MDNLARFYRARYKTAETYALAGEHDKCLDICWSLRIEPDLGLWRRALVNLVITCNADYSKHPDKAKFVHECLDLLAEVRREGVHPDDEPVFRKFEGHARQTLKDIDKEAEIYAAHEAARLEARKPMADLEAAVEDQDVEDTQEEGSQSAPSAQDKQSIV